jgi:hypothetical protein
MAMLSRWFALIILTVVSLSLSISFWWLPHNNSSSRRTVVATTATTSDGRFGGGGGILAAVTSSSFRQKQQLADAEEIINEQIQQHAHLRDSDSSTLDTTLDGTQKILLLRQQHDHLRTPTKDEADRTKDNVTNEDLEDHAAVIRAENNTVATKKMISPTTMDHHGASGPDDDAKNGPSLPFGYNSWDEVTNRSSRFPTVDERVRVYMTNWYAPPCGDDGNNNNNSNNKPDAFVRYTTEVKGGVETMLFIETRTEKEKKRGPLRTFSINATVGFDELHYTKTKLAAFQDCTNAYCSDMVKYLFPVIPPSDRDLPILFQFSDAEKTRAYSTTKGKTVAYPNTPLFKKFRYALSQVERERMTAPCHELPRPVPVTAAQEQHQHDVADGVLSGARTVVTSQPIVFKLKIQRHYGYLTSIPEVDRPWSDKQNRAIFRGQFTGKLPANHNATTAIEQCILLPRCNLVHASAASLLVDAKLALPILEARKDFASVLDGIELYSERVSLQDMLSYKAIIMLEGNDVSSGLKWALFSNSVVMAQSPTKTSWAMEEM